MLEDMIRNLQAAIKGGKKKEIDRAYKALERVGMDRFTAMYLANRLGGEESESVPRKASE